jgi:hypothetical protein
MAHIITSHGAAQFSHELKIVPFRWLFHLVDKRGGEEQNYVARTAHPGLLSRPFSEPQKYLVLNFEARMIAGPNPIRQTIHV